MESWESKKDEEILWASAKKPQLFGILVDRYQAAFLRAAGRVVKNKEEAEDVVQDAFLKIYKNSGRFKKQAGIEFKSWAYRIVINTSCSAYRKLRSKNLSQEMQEEYLENIPSSERLDETFGLQHLVKSVLDDLPEDTRAVLAAHYLEDKSYQTIAREKKISVAALKTRLHRARKAFEAALDHNQ